MELNFHMDFSSWRTAFEGIQYRAENLIPAHERIGDYLVTEITYNIVTQGGAASWPPLKQSTLDRRRIEHPEAGNLMLVVTGELLLTLTKKAVNEFVDVGSTLKKARLLFFGSEQRNVPARSPFVWQSGVMDRVLRFYFEHIMGGAY